MWPATITHTIVTLIRGFQWQNSPVINYTVVVVVVVECAPHWTPTPPPPPRSTTEYIIAPRPWLTHRSVASTRWRRPMTHARGRGKPENSFPGENRPLRGAVATSRPENAGTPRLRTVNATKTESRARGVDGEQGAGTLKSTRFERAGFQRVSSGLFSCSGPRRVSVITFFFSLKCNCQTTDFK